STSSSPLRCVGMRRPRRSSGFTRCWRYDRGPQVRVCVQRLGIHKGGGNEEFAYDYFLRSGWRIGKGDSRRALAAFLNESSIQSHFFPRSHAAWSEACDCFQIAVISDINSKPKFMTTYSTIAAIIASPKPMNTPSLQVMGQRP